MVIFEWIDCRSRSLMENQKEKIILVAPALNAFIQTDWDILATEYKVVTNVYNWRNKILTPLFLIHQFFILLFQTPSAKAIVVEFGGYWSLVPSLLGKFFKTPVYIVLHGTDCAHLPSIGYGSLRKKWIYKFCKIAYRNAHHLLPVSDSLAQTNNTYNLNILDQKQGFKNHFANLNTPYTTIHNGLDCSNWESEIQNKEPNSFLSVFTNSQFILKGGDLIIKAAKKYPNSTFYMVGVNTSEQLKNIPSNVKLLGRLTPEELKEMYQKCEFHFQLSMFEGFGLALCEAMLGGCIPIGSSVNFIPEIIGDTGFVVQSKNDKQLYAAIEKAMNSDNKIERAKAARERIKTHFPLEKRKQELLEVIRKG